MHRLPIVRLAVPTVALACVVGPTALAAGDVLTLSSPNTTIGGRFGDAVSTIGDVNADGYNDVLVGAPIEAPAGLSASGRAVIYSGRTGTLLRTHTSPTAVSNGKFGQSVIGFPDLNGDGVADYAIGAPGEANGFGRLHVYSGATGTQLYAVDGLTPLTFTSIALVPDCTGDGLPEMVAGIFGNLTSFPVEVREAKNGAVWKTLVDPSPQSLDLFGKSVGGVPDVTGDGKGDVIVAAERADPPGRGGSSITDAGRVYVFDGATGALWLTIDSPDQSTSGHFGQSVAGLPDIDGDGRGEIVIGAPYESAANGFDGRVHLHSGASGALIRTMVSADPAPWPFTSGEFGYAVRSCPDLDGDGKWDIVVGAPEEHLSTTETGRAYCYASATGALLGMYEAPGSTAKRFGHCLDASRDVNGDESPDLIVGSPDAVLGTQGPVGLAYLFRFVPGDGCSAGSPPIPIVDGTYPFTTVGGANDFPFAPLCGGDAGFFTADVFYEYVASCTGTLTVSTCGTADFNTTIAIYKGCTYAGGDLEPCDSSNLVACNADGQGCPGGTSLLTIPTAAGTCYRIRIGGLGTGSGTFTVGCASACPADLNHDGIVGPADLALLLGAWNTSGPADLDANGTVGSSDLAILLGAWGPC